MGPDVVTSIADARATLDAARAAGSTIGFVPTMGFLHDGHGSLIRAAAEADDVVVVSVFVNPLQFGAGEDLEDYPRDLDNDRAVAGAAGADLLLVPTADEMYPSPPVLTSVSVADLGDRWDGVSRPTHFAGMATVVAKLCNIVGPCRAYFGQKDFQQLAIVRRMVADLSMPVEVVGCPTVREPDGLALSSRNSYLSGSERAAAAVLSRALAAGGDTVAAGVGEPAEIERAMAAVLATEPLAEPDYVAVVEPDTLRTPDAVTSRVQLLVAATVGTTRLIDNTAATPPTPAPGGGDGEQTT